MKKIILLIVCVMIMHVNAEILEDNNYTKYNYCTYTNGNQILEIDRNVSLDELKRKKEFLLTNKKKYDLFYFKIEYNGTIPLKVSQYTLVTERLLKEKLFDKNGYLSKIINYDANHTVCNVQHDFKKKQTETICNNGDKTITFYKNMSDEGYKFLKYKHNKYIGKNLIDWNRGKYYEYDNNNKLIYQTDEPIHLTDTIEFFDINSTPPIF